MKRIISILLAVLMIVSAIPFAVLPAFAADYKQGDIIEFGYYPQSEVTDSSLISALNAEPGTWVSYNYYIESKQSDYMKYKDVYYYGNKYRAVTFSSYRPYLAEYSSSTLISYQDNNGYTTNTTYWFKYEPLKWRVLDPAAGLVLCESIIDAQAYRDTYYTISYYYHYTDSTKNYYANNYEQSTIRTWLNDTFYNTAFSNSQQNLITATTINNDAYSTDYSEYDAKSTTDKIYLLSYSDVKKTAYGFASSTSSSTTREASGTDYAKSQGLFVNKSSSGYGKSSWWLRTPRHDSFYACSVDFGGSADYYDSVDYTGGVRPALKLNLKSDGGHSYKPAWSWKADRSGATLTLTCTDCGETVKRTATAANGKLTSATVKATCGKEGKTTYTAKVTCDGKTYKSTKTKTLEKLGHSYGTSKWIWDASVDSAAATYRKTCSNCGNVTGSSAAVTSSVTKKATASATGTVKYTAKIKVGTTTKTSTKSVTIPKTGTAKLSYTKTAYNGSKKAPTVTVKDSSGKTISSANYTVSGLTHTVPGTYKVTVTFKNRYSGTKTLTYTINKHSAKADGNKATWSSLPNASKYEVYVDGTKKTTTTSKSYTVKDCGNHKVYVIAVFRDGTKSKKSYTTEVVVSVPHVWSSSLDYCVNCGYVNVIIGKVKNFRRLSDDAWGNVVFGWSSVSGADGYELSRFDNTKGEWVTFNMKIASSPIGIKMPSGGSFSFKIRAFKNVNGKKIYGNYSDVLKIRT